MYQLGIGGINEIEKKNKINMGRNYDLYATADYRKFNFFSKAAYQVRDDKVLFSDLDIPVTHISYTDSDMTGPVLM